jgi:hypothetical protein
MTFDALGIAGDIIQAGAALAGLMLVFVGNAVAGFATFPKEDQRAVLSQFSQRACFGFWGVLVSLLAAFFAVLAKWNGVNALAIVAAILLIVALGWAGVCAWSTAKEVK